MLLMHKHKGSLAASLESQRDSTVGYGSEFRNEATLYHLFACHPNWNRMTPILRNGSEWPLEPLDEDSRRADVDEALNSGTTRAHRYNPNYSSNSSQRTSTADTVSRYRLERPSRSRTF